MQRTLGLTIHCLCSCSEHLDLLYIVYVHAANTWTYYTLSMFMQRTLELTIHCLCSCSDHLNLLYIVYVHAAITWTCYTLSMFMQRSLGLTIHCLCSCSDHLNLLYIIHVHAAITWTYYTLPMFMQRSLGLTTHCLCSCSDHLDLPYIAYVHAAITCDPLANITFGQYNNINCVTQKSFYNDTCEVMCDFGYVLHGPPVQRCTLKWEWAPKTKGHCERKHLLSCTKNGITL